MPEFATIDEYDRWARQCIAAFAPKYRVRELMGDPDIIAEVAYKLMDADNRYNDEIGNRVGFRKAQGKFAVKRIVHRKLNKNSKTVSLDDCLTSNRDKYALIEDPKAEKPESNITRKEDMGHLHKLMHHCLTPHQYEVVTAYYLNGKTLEEIGPTRQAASQCLAIAIQNLRNSVANEQK